MNGISESGIPDGAGELPKASKVRGIDREANKGGSVGDEPNKIDTTPMSDAARKGATGKPINAASVPVETGSQSAEQYGLGRGKFGANTGQS